MKYCIYPQCHCIVSTSTTHPEPDCPQGFPVAPKPLDEMIALWEGIAQLHYKAAQLGSGGSNPLPLTRSLGIVTALKHYKIALENDR